MAIHITGFLVRAQTKYVSPLKEGERVPPIRKVSGKFVTRSSAEQFRDLYSRSHPTETVWIDDLQADDGLT